MARKRHTPEQIIAELRQVDVLASQGTAVADAICESAVGLNADQSKPILG